MMANPSPAQIFKDWLGVRPAAGRLLAALYERSDEVVPFDELAAAAGQTRNGCNFSLKLLRAAMERGAILNQPRAGYRLSSRGIDECERALADARARGVKTAEQPR